MKSYLVYQVNKTKRKKVVGLLQPIPVLEKHWEDIFMDFINEFPKVHDFKSIFIIVDRFSKYYTWCMSQKWGSKVVLQPYGEIL